MLTTTVATLWRNNIRNSERALVGERAAGNDTLSLWWDHVEVATWTSFAQTNAVTFGARASDATLSQRPRYVVVTRAVPPVMYVRHAAHLVWRKLCKLLPCRGVWLVIYLSSAYFCLLELCDFSPPELVEFFFTLCVWRLVYLSCLISFITELCDILFTWTVWPPAFLNRSLTVSFYLSFVMFFLPELCDFLSIWAA